MRTPGLDACLHRGSGVVDVHMDIPQRRGSAHDEAVAEQLKFLPQSANRRLVGVEEVHDLESRAV